MNRFVDFLVSEITFYLSCLTLSVELGNGLFTQILAYSTALLVFVRLCKWAVVKYNNSASEIYRQLLGNAAGIVIGNAVMLLFEQFLLTEVEVFVAIILSGAVAFFILGTLSPIVQNVPRL